MLTSETRPQTILLPVKPLFIAFTLAAVGRTVPDTVTTFVEPAEPKVTVSPA